MELTDKVVREKHLTTIMVTHNLRYAVVLLVIVYHGFYLFNSVGVISNVDVQGIPALDVVEYVLYPWFMACLQYLLWAT